MELDVGYQIPDTKIMPGIAVEEEILGVLSCLLPNNLVFRKVFSTVESLNSIIKLNDILVFVSEIFENTSFLFDIEKFII